MVRLGLIFGLKTLTFQKLGAKRGPETCIFLMSRQYVDYLWINLFEIVSQCAIPQREDCVWFRGLWLQPSKNKGHKGAINNQNTQSFTVVGLMRYKVTRECTPKQTFILKLNFKILCKSVSRWVVLLVMKCKSLHLVCQNLILCPHSEFNWLWYYHAALS